MKTEIKLLSLTQLLILAFYFVFVVGNTSIAAQDSIQAKEKQVQAPSEEKFHTATDLIVPWRSSGCHIPYKDYKEPNCHVVTAIEWQNTHLLTLYDADGGVWYNFSVQPGKPLYFLRNKTVDFLPFATYPNGSDTPDVVILRLARESASWYEVEVNEKTRATKYVLKSDLMWAQTSWKYWLHQSFNLKIDTRKTPLLDKPDGAIIEETIDIGEETFRFLKADGDWAFVQYQIDQRKYQGWVRWRKDRDILVGWVLNNNKVQ